MMTLFYIMIPFALFGVFTLACLAVDRGVFVRKIAQEPFDPIKHYGYDPDSPMVVKFQILAGIKPMYASRKSLRERFNRVRMGCTNHYARG